MAEKAKREKFKGYLEAALSLNDAARAEGKERVTTAEVLRMAGMSGSRFNIVVNSALFVATCSEPETGGIPDSRGSAVYYQVKELVELLMSLHDYKAQMELWNDCQNLEEEDFQKKYRDKSKRMVFNGKHPVIVPDSEYLKYEVIIQ